MRRPSSALRAVLVGAIVCAATPAVAKTVEIAQPGEVKKRPRSVSRAVLELRAGDKVRVLDRRGDWLQVMVKGEKGWLHSSALEAAPRGFDKGQSVTTSGEAELRTRPGGGGEVLFEVGPGEAFRVAKDEGEFVEVVDETETRGWLPRTALGGNEKAKGSARAEQSKQKPAWEQDEEPAEVASIQEDNVDEAFALDDEAPLPDEEATVTGDEHEVQHSVPSGGALFGLDIRVGADVGILSVSQDFSADGAGLRNNYALTNNTPAVVLRASADRPFGRWIAGLDVQGHTTFAGGGLTGEGQDSMDEAIGWSQYGLEAALHGSYAIDSRFTAGAHVGGYRWVRGVEADDLLALPSEASGGAVIGARGSYADGAWSAAAGVDMIATAGLTQREGLTDGTDASLSGQRYRVNAGYQVTPAITAEAAYHGSRTRYEFDGESERSDDGGVRNEHTHLVAVGARYSF